MKEQNGILLVPSSSILKPFDWGRVFIYLLLLAGIYYSTFDWLISHDWVREDYNYAYLVPLIVLYLIWEKKNELFSGASSPSWIAIVPLALGLSFFWLGELSGEFFALYFSFWVLVVSLFWMHMGWGKMRVIWFPIVFILAMFPAPNFLHIKITASLQLISSKLGVLFMQAYGMTAHREGNVIDLGFTQLQVVEACSGLRYVIPLFILGILMAYFFKSASWKRILFVLSTIPLSIFVNSFRIALTGILYQHFGAEVAEGFFHGFSGWLIFVFCLPLMMVFKWVLGKIPLGEQRSAGSGQRSEKDTGHQQQSEPSQPYNNFNEDQQTQSGRLGYRALLSPHFVVTVVLLGATLALSHGVEFRERIPTGKPISQFPLQVGAWSGAGQPMEQKFIDTLDLTDYAIINYKDPNGKFVNFYVAYYESQRKGESIHSPETCLPGGGWVFEQSGQKVIPVQGYADGAFKVKRAYIHNGPYRQLSYFWFPQRGRILTNAWQLKMYTFWDALTRQRTDGALVRLITPVAENERIEDADRRLTKFTQEMVPVLDQFIPGAGDRKPGVASQRS